MNAPLSPEIRLQSMDLTPQEQRLVKTLRLLPQVLPDGVEQVEEFVSSLVARNLKWSYDDPASTKLAAEFMALDPDLKRESDAITADFACMEADGLEDD